METRSLDGSPRKSREQATGDRGTESPPPHPAQHSGPRAPGGWAGIWLVFLDLVPASIAINGNQTQSAQVGTAFGSLAVTVKDGGGVTIPKYASVTFTAGTAGSGAAGGFLEPVRG